MQATVCFLLAASGLDAGLAVNPIKVGIVVALLLLWGLAIQWVDRDTDVVKTKREHWNIIVLSGGLVGFFALFVPPWSGNAFVLGVIAFLLLAGGAVQAYLMHRNSRVVAAARVGNIAHLKRVMSGGDGQKRAKDEKGQRVRLADHAGKSVSFPTDVEEARDFEATQDFLYDLLWRRATDADAVAGKEKYRLVYRIDGIAVERQEGIPPDQGERVFRYLKRLAGLNAEEIRRPQLGKVQTALLSHPGDMGYTEVQTSGTTAGERLRLRIQSGPIMRKLADLGLAPARLEQLKELIHRPHGLLLITGEAQNGLTTTQYAMLKSHDAYMQNIHTLERRKLVDLDNMTQRIYEGTNADVNFARMLQTILRREPDIVLVGECEDRETAQVAARAAAEERKVYMGLHAKDSFDALQKFMSFVDENKTASKALIGILHQRLVRALCTNCREAFRPDPATLKKLNLPVDKIDRFYRPPTKPILDKKGREITCDKCQGTGYVGRIGLFELLIVDAAISQLIAEGAPINKIKSQCRKNKMYYLQEEGLLKVIDGTTSMNEILRGVKAEGE